MNCKQKVSMPCTKTNLMNPEFRQEKNCPSDWNKNLTKSEMGNVFNTFEYSEYARHRLNWEPAFLSVIDNTGRMVAQVVLFEYSRNKIKKISASLNRLALKLSNTIKWIYGPIIFSQESDTITNDFLAYIQKKGKRLDGSTHPLFKGTITTEGIKTKKWSTFIIDLQQPKSSILDSLDKKSVRKNIERAEERGVQIREIDEKSIDEYHQILNEFRLVSGNKPLQVEDTYELWNLLQKAGFKGFLASKDGINIGGITFSFFNGYLNEWGIARTEKDTNEKLYGQDLLKWKIIEWGIENKQKFYDLSGFNPNPSTEKETGILRYKKKWGGKQYDFWLVRK